MENTGAVWHRKQEAWRSSMEEQHLANADGSSLAVLTFPLLEKSGLCRHLFSTRTGGVSGGIYATMNPGFDLGDDEENVLENHRRLLHVLGAELQDAVRSCQEHGTHLRVVTAADRGKGFCRPRDYRNTDGLMTDVPGIVLCIYASDCVPLLFLDPVRQVIAAVHSGWKGTAGGIGRRTVEAMGRIYGCQPEDILCGIGPSICRDCYEVSEDVARVFQRDFPDDQDDILQANDRGRYQLDLQQTCRRMLLDAGLLPEHLQVSDLCTCCNPDRLFSHRASGGRRGNNAGMIMLLP